MAIRLKVNREALIAQAEAVLVSMQERIEKTKQEQDAWDWKDSARQGVEQLVAALDNPETTEKSFDSLWSEAKRDRPSFNWQLRDLKAEAKALRDFIDVLKMNSEELVSVSTSDEEILAVVRAARKNSA